MNQARVWIVHPTHTEYITILTYLLIVRGSTSQGSFFKKGIPKVCQAFLSRICHAAVFKHFGYADSKSAPCQALFCLFPTQNSKTKWLQN